MFRHRSSSSSDNDSTDSSPRSLLQQINRRINRRHSSSSSDNGSNYSSPRSLVRQMPNLFRSSSTLNSTPSSPSSPGSRSNSSVVSSDMAQPRNIDEASETVPLTTVRALLMGSIDPIELAQQILPAKDIPAVVRYNSTPYREKVDLKGHPLVTQEDVLFVGLSYVGFEGERYNVREKLKFDRFFAHYKLHPLTVLDVWNYFNEHDEAFGKRDFKVFLYTLNFLKLYETEHVLSGRWQQCEDTLHDNIWRTLRIIQSHVHDFIYYDPNEFKAGQVHHLTVDTVNYTVEEARTGLAEDEDEIEYENEEDFAEAQKRKYKRWYDHKSNSAGVKYEMALPLCLERQTLAWCNGPYPAGDKKVAHDGCLFRGGALDVGRQNWDPDSLYNRLPDGKKAIGDSLYGGMPEKCTISLNEHTKQTRDLINRAKARQERYHGHTKEFYVLKNRFRHGKESAAEKLSKHKTCVDVINILMHFELKHRPLMSFP